jgi:hypothetical protein
MARTSTITAAERAPSSAERSLLLLLVQKAGRLDLPDGWLGRLRVRAMGDGGMGSLRLIADADGVARLFGRRVAEHQFRDDDGVEVLASLNVDQQGQLYELDIWKTDFSRLIRLEAALETSG